MHHKLLNYFSKIMLLTAEEQIAITENMCIKTFKKGKILLKQGQISTECYFVFKGCVRQYSVIDGEERTMDFFTEEQFVVSINSFSQKTPANHYFECIEETTLMIGNEAKENELYKRFPKFETVSRKVMENLLGLQQEAKTKYLTQTSKERYLNLLKNRPDLFQRIPQYQLASYIGIKPESLSRIRKRILENI